MEALSPFHLIIILAVIVLLFGGKKIPEVAKGLGEGIRNFKTALKSDDDEKIEEDDDFDQQRHARHEDLRAEKHPVLQHEEAENLADSLVPDGQHQKADQLHRQHHGQREDDNRSGKIKRRPDAIGDREREEDREGAYDQA